MRRNSLVALGCRPLTGLARRLMLGLVLVLAALVATPAEAKKAKKKPVARYYIKILGTETSPKVPKELSEKAKALLPKLFAEKPEYLATLPPDAPDPDKNPDAFRAYLKKKKLRAFSVLIKFTAYDKAVEPPAEGKKHDVLKVHVGISLIGNELPSKTMAAAGEGDSTVGVEVGKKISPADARYADEETLRGAMVMALNDWSVKLDEFAKKNRK